MREIDSEVGDLSKDAINGQKAFTYLRYNVEMKPETLVELKINGISKEKIDDLMNMDSAENVEDLIRIGEASAKVNVSAKHFPEAFNLKGVPVT